MLMCPREGEMYPRNLLCGENKSIFSHFVFALPEGQIPKNAILASTLYTIRRATPLFGTQLYL